jgi:hypothetical protein
MMVFIRFVLWSYANFLPTVTASILIVSGPYQFRFIATGCVFIFLFYTGKSFDVFSSMRGKSFGFEPSVLTRK